MMAARIKLGDRALRKKVRTAMLGSYSGTWMATCDNKLVRAFGGEAADAGVLIRHLGRPDRGLDHGVTNTAYGRLLELVSESRFLPRKQLRKAFEERATWPHVADPSAGTFVSHYPVYNNLVLAALGDKRALRAVMAVLVNTSDQSGLAWLAAYWSIRLKLPGTEKAVATLMVGGGVARDSNRSGIYRGIRSRVLNAFVATYPKSSAWAAMVVNADGNASERALYHLSRRRPPQACAPAIRAAYKTRGRLTDRAAEFGLLALTALGDACLARLETMAADGKAPRAARGAALEIAAALGSNRVSSLAKSFRATDARHPAPTRALKIAQSRSR